MITQNELLTPSEIQPTVKKLLPFPLENIEEQLADVYFELDKIRKRIEVSKRNNVVNLTEARINKLKQMQYKINTAMNLVKNVTKDLDSFWIN
jgi:hypothetical protein